MGAGNVAEAMRLLWVLPRFGGSTVGGAERLVGELAARGVPDEWRSEVASTCAADHFTWANELPPGESVEDGIVVRRFEVGRRDPALYERLHAAILAGMATTRSSSNGSQTAFGRPPFCAF